MEFNERLKQFIKLNFDSQTEYAVKLSIDSSLLNRYIKGNTKPDVKTLVRLYNSGLSIDWLLTGIGSMYAANINGLILQLGVQSLLTDNLLKYYTENTKFPANRNRSNKS